MSRLGHEDQAAQRAKVVYLPRVGLAWEPWVPPTNHPVAREVELGGGGGSHRDTHAASAVAPPWLVCSYSVTEFQFQ